MSVAGLISLQCLCVCVCVFVCVCVCVCVCVLLSCLHAVFLVSEQMQFLCTLIGCEYTFSHIRAYAHNHIQVAY